MSGYNLDKSRGGLIKSDQDQTFITDIESKARVERHEIQNEGIERANKVINEIGSAMAGTVVPKGFQYLGSAAVHYYHAPNIGALTLVSQVNGTMRDVPEVLAQKGITDLRNSMLNYYGQKRQTKRSGF